MLTGILCGYCLLNLKLVFKLFVPSSSSNRAECYLKTNQSYRAMRDCNKALAQNPNNLRIRWRRAQAFQNMNKRYAAALDLL